MRRSGVGLFIALFVSGCGGGGLTAAHAPRSTPAAVAVSEDAFPGAVRDLLLSEPNSKEEKTRLRGVEERQMLRAAAQFKTHAPERGLASVHGGLYLVRTGQIDAALTPSAAGALFSAVREAAGHGDEGSSQALYNLLARITPPANKKEIQQHLDAIHAWLLTISATGSPTERAGALENAAVARAMLEPTEESLVEAQKRIEEWVEAAIRFSKALRAGKVVRSQAAEQEQLEAIRALNTGGSLLAVIHLRTGDVTGALAAIDEVRNRARNLQIDDPNGFTEPGLLQALQDVDKSADAPHRLALLRSLRPHPVRNDDGSRPPGRDEEMQADVDQPELLRAAAFGVAREAFRADPSMPESAGAVAIALQEYGMADASPAVLVDAVRAHADARVVGESLALTMNAIAAEVDAADTDGARRAFRSAAPLLALADQKSLAGQVTPSSARLRAMMGEVELHDGRVDEARKLFEAAAAQEPSGGVLAALARIDRATGKIPSASARLQRALAAPDTARDPSLHGEILLMQSDIARDAGDANAARSLLSDALKGLAKARTGAEGEALARIERMLARVLDRFGAAKPARQALDRALEASPHDKDEVAATLGIAVAAALVHNDVESARAGLRRGGSSDLTDEDLVYLALWTRAAEKQMKLPSSGDAEKVFAGVADDGRWIGRLAAFGAGKLKADDLIASAKTPAQQTEAYFYAALEHRAAGDAAGAQALFQKTLGSGGVDLMEVGLARDISSGPKAYVAGPVPEVGLP